MKKRSFLIILPIIAGIVFLFLFLRSRADEGHISYSLLILEDEDGKRTLMKNYLDTAALIPVELDDEKEKALYLLVGEEAEYSELWADYEMTQDKATGLCRILKKGMDPEFSNIILRNDEDIQKYKELAEAYSKAYKEVLSDLSVAYIYADYEAKGRAKRFPEGFFFYHMRGMQYLDTKNSEDSWSLDLTYDEYRALDEKIDINELPFDVSSFDAWKETLDSLGIEYDIKADHDSPRYKAAEAHIKEIMGDDLQKMSAEEKERLVTRRLKEFDSDGYMLNIFGVSGMDVGRVPLEERAVIIPVAEEYKKRLFEFERSLCKDSLEGWRNIDEKSRIYRDYQLSLKKEDRLKGTYILSQYERRFFELLSADCDITYEEAMARIKVSPDSKTLELLMDPVVDEALRRSRDSLNRWMAE